MRYEVITVIGHGEKPPYTFLDKVNKAIQHGAILVGGISVACNGAVIYWSQAVLYTHADGVHVPHDKTRQLF